MMFREGDQGCLYCGSSTVNSKSAAHAFPEAILPGGAALPPGVVCDKCNHYFGVTLEPVLLGYPFVALPIQIAALPGKRRKPRKRIGLFDREVNPEAAVTFEVEAPEISTDADGVRTARVTVNPVVDPAFDMDRLRRALHHIGLNLLALNEGLDEARSRKYDAVRRYVRAPNRGQRWPFIQVTEQLDVLRLEVAARALHFPGAKVIRLRILNTDYYLDLWGTGCLLDAHTSGGRAQLIGPDWKPSFRKGPRNKRYRVSIY